MRDDTDRSQLPRIVDLANEPDFYLGGLRVQPALRRVSAGGSEESVEPRVMQALVALAEANGAVLSRDALTDRCWGGRIVGEDAINRCIGKVRKLADATTPPAFAIETVAKVGYRLIRAPAAAGGDLAPETIPDTDTPLADTERPASAARVARAPAPSTFSPRAWLAGAASLIIVAACAALLWPKRSAPEWAVQSSRKLPASNAGETNPRLSPNGTMMAYAADASSGHGRVYVRGLAGGVPLLISGAGENADHPAWSADGTHLAYVSVGDGGGAACRIMVTTFPGGSPHIAGPCHGDPDPMIEWRPGTPDLYVTAQPSALLGVIRRIDTETGTSEQVTAPETAETDWQPRVSPDGKFLAYIRDHGLRGETLRVRTLDTGEERTLANDPDIQALDWVSDSQSLIVGANGERGAYIRAYPIDGGPGYPIYSSPSSLSALSTASNGMLAMATTDAHRVLARASPAPRTTPDVIDSAAGMTDWPAFAPDGTLLFVSNRSGEAALWKRRPGGQPTLFLGFGDTHVERPVWSPDGGRIAFVQIHKGDISIHVVTAQGEPVTAFDVPSIGFGEPVWTPDGSYLIAFDRRIFQPVRIEVAHPDHREPAAGKFWDTLTYRRGALYGGHGVTPGLWRLDGTPRQITPDYPASHPPAVCFWGDTVLLPDDTPKRGSVAGADPLRIMAQPLDGGAAHVAFYAPGAMADTSLAVDPVTGDVIYVSEIAADRHIDLLTLARK